MVVLAPRLKEGREMTELIIGIIGLALIVYLFISVLRPEKF
jgi:K+-transporting ATPase KdpF subunit